MIRLRYIRSRLDGEPAMAKRALKESDNEIEKGDSVANSRLF